MSFSTLEDFLARARRALDPLDGPGELAETGDLDHLPEGGRAIIRPAAVLVPIIKRVNEPTVLLTTRPETMSTHAGQVAFPGGKVDAGDKNEVAAALREAHEEVGLGPEGADLVARGAPYLTGTGFRIVPVLATVPGDFVPAPDPTEVANAFEVPMRLLFDPLQFERRTALYRGRRRAYYAMTHEGHYIWGVTAGIIRTLHEQIYAGES